MKTSPKHLLVIRLSAMGDVAMTVPVLRALVLQHPEVKITVVSRPFFEPFFEEIPNVYFFCVDLKKRHKGFIGLLRLFKDLHALKVDLVADLHNVLRSKVVRNLFALSGKKTVATDKGRAEKKALTRVSNKVFSPVKTMIDRHVETFQKLDFSIYLSNPVFPPAKDLSPDILKITDIKTHKWIGIAPFAQYESKVYPLDLMAEVIQQLSAHKNLSVFLFGGGALEIQKLQQLQNNQPNVKVLAGKLKLKQELAVISNLDVMLSMDSGNAHIAAMLGIPVITLWGATHPYAGFAPFHQPINYSITADRNKFPLLPTSIYGNKTIPGYEDVMRTIAPKEVVEKLMHTFKISNIHYTSS
jgi:ADP-heptose:LPS heptosyltransferase